MPLYEQQADVDVAINAAKAFAAKFIDSPSYRVSHFSKESKIDVAITYCDSYNQRRLILFEHKRRNHKKGLFPSVWLSYGKYCVLISVPAVVVPIFCVTWNDVRGYVNLSDVRPFRITITRRELGQRRDDTEEPIAEFDVRDFQEF
jgi:hypothetical protein